MMMGSLFGPRYLLTDRNPYNRKNRLIVVLINKNDLWRQFYQNFQTTSSRRAAMTPTTVIFVLLLVFVDAADRCYDCDATEKDDECVDPVKNNVRVAVCDQNAIRHTGVQSDVDDVNKNDIDIKFGTRKREYDCYTLYYEGDGAGKETGVYRGCTERPPDARNSCDLLVEALTNGGNITKCEYCAEDECNRDKLKLNGSDEGGSGANSVQLSVLINVVVFAFCVLNAIFIRF